MPIRLDRRAFVSGFASATLASTGLVAMPAVAQTAGEPVELKVSTFLPAQDALVKILRTWTDEIAERSNGHVRFTYFPSSQMGPIDRQFDLARTGAADIVLFIHGSTPGRFPMTELAYLPGRFDGLPCEKGAAVLQGLVPDYLAGEHAGTRILGIAPTPESFVFSVEKLASVEALSGLRIRHPGAPMADALRAVGAVPVAVPSPEMNDALAKGLVDGLGINWQAAADWRIEEVGTKVLSVPFGAVTFGVVMNEARFESLPKESQQLIRTTSADFGRQLGRELDVAEAEAADRLRPRFEVTTPDGADLKRFRSVLEARRETWIDAAASRGLPAREYAQRLVAGIRDAAGRS